MDNSIGLTQVVFDAGPPNVLSLSVLPRKNAHRYSIFHCKCNSRNDIATIHIRVGVTFSIRIANDKSLDSRPRHFDLWRFRIKKKKLCFNQNYLKPKRTRIEWWLFWSLKFQKNINSITSRHFGLWLDKNVFTNTVIFRNYVQY